MEENYCFLYVAKQLNQNLYNWRPANGERDLLLVFKGSLIDSLRSIVQNVSRPIITLARRLKQVFANLSTKSNRQ